jgi:transcriptional regulator of arginine metabolism
MPVMNDARVRLSTLKEILLEGKLSTQDELREELESRKFSVTQSTISRDLKRVGAIKTLDLQGRTVYRLHHDLQSPVPSPVAHSLRDLVSAIRSNGNIIVINTTPGSASLVARHLDSQKPGGIIGTIAGDDTIFIAPKSIREIQRTITAIEASLIS